MARRTQRKSVRYSAPAAVSRKATIMGSHKLHTLYKKAHDNKAITAAVMGVVLSISAMFISSKGGYLESWTTMRDTLKSVPYGNKLANFLQKMMDSILRLFGWGIRVGDVVEPRDVETTLVEARSLTISGGQKWPPVDETYDNFFPHRKFIVANIDPHTRTFRAIVYDDNRDHKSNTKQIAELIKKANEDKKVQNVSLLVRVGHMNSAASPHIIIKPNTYDAVDFNLDHFKKSKQSEQFKKEKP